MEFFPDKSFHLNKSLSILISPELSVNSFLKMFLLRQRKGVFPAKILQLASLLGFLPFKIGQSFYILERMTESVVEVIGLTKVFKTLKAVDHVSFSVEPGEILGLLGPNGAGKTTIIHMLLGLTEPTSEVINIFGLNSVSASRRKSWPGDWPSFFSLSRLCFILSPCCLLPSGPSLAMFLPPMFSKGCEGSSPLTIFPTQSFCGLSD